ncbi:MAG: 50S ribosomal protein L4 [Ilumatobacteraceae bacterium]
MAAAKPKKAAAKKAAPKKVVVKKAATKKVVAKKADTKSAAPKKAAKTVAPKTGNTASLPAEFFGIEPNISVMHQVVTAQLAHRRSGTQSTKTRAEVRGGGSKPFSQKGTGNARQGSIRAPHFSGGGVALGPKPRKYSQRTPKKMIQLALRSALSDRALDNKVVVVDEFTFDAPSTKSASSLLGALGLDGKVMVVVEHTDVIGSKSFRNISNVQVVTTGELNAYDVLSNDWILFTQASLPKTLAVAK